MAVSLGVLNVDLKLATNAFFKGIKATQKRINGLVNRVKSLSKVFLNLKGVLAGVAGVAGVGALVSSSMSAIDVLGKLSDQTGIATEKIATYQLAAELAGVQQEKLNDSLRGMNKRIGEAAMGFGSAKPILKEFGWDAKKLAELQPDKTFELIADKISKLGTQAEKAAAASALFGRQGMHLLNLFEAGIPGLQEAQKDAEAFGLALARVDAKKVEDANDMLTRVKRVVTGIGNRISVALAPFITEIGERFINSARNSRSFEDSIQATIKNVAKGIGFLVDTINGVGVAWSALKFSWAALKLTLLTGIDALINAFVTLANTIIDVVIAPIKDTLRLVSKFSDTAKDLLAGLNNIKIDPFDGMKASINETIEEVDRLGEALDKRLGTPPPSKGVDEFFAGVENKTKLMEKNFKASASSAAPISAETVKAAENTAKLTEATKRQTAQTKALERAAQKYGDTLVDAAMTGEFSFKNMINSMIQDWIRFQTKQAVFGATGGVPGGDSGFGGGLIGGIAGLFKADGGPVKSNSPYIVGERGPELFVPKSSGSIVPNEALASSGGGMPQQSAALPVTINIENRGAPQQAQATSQVTPQGVVVDIILQDLNNSGPISKGIKQKVL